MWCAFMAGAPRTFMRAVMLAHLHISCKVGPRFSIRSFPCYKKGKYTQSIISKQICTLCIEISKIYYSFLPAANFWPRIMFCLLFHQHAANTTRNRKATSTPKAMPIFAATDKWGPHSRKPGIPHNPALSVKLSFQKFVSFPTIQVVIKAVDTQMCI